MKQFFSKNTFCGLQGKYSEKVKSHFLILPVPYEATTTYGHGTANGPKAIIDASLNMEFFDEELRQETYELGIHTLPFMNLGSAKPEEALDKLTDYVYKMEIEQKDKTLISIGGEHSISPGIVRAFKKNHSNLSVLQLDAHADLRDSYQGSSYSHACSGRRILEDVPLVPCGIRSFSKEESDFIEKTGQEIFFGKTALKNISKIKSLLSDEIYITLDIDILDPSIMPSTGTPEPDGWNWRELCNFLKEIILKKKVVGIDIVELAPIPGLIAPDFTTAKLIYRIMGYIALSKKWLTVAESLKFSRSI